MHANYPSPQLAARGENGLHHAKLQLNFFTLPQFAINFPGFSLTLEDIEDKVRVPLDYWREPEIPLPGAGRP
jgi:hypothetical protein